MSSSRKHFLFTLQRHLSLSAARNGIGPHAAYVPISLASLYIQQQQPQLHKHMYDSRRTRHEATSKNQRGLPLSNEKLIRILMKKTAAPSADDVQLRMIVDDNPRDENEKNGKTTTSIASLAEAIRVSIESDKDLIEVSLDQEIPVVKVACLKSLAYKNSKVANARQNGSAPRVKEFRFRAGIAENDMKRKMDNMISFLTDGHRCLVQIRARRRELNLNPNAVKSTIVRIMEKIEGVAEPMKKPTIHPEGISGQLHLQPTANK